MWKIEAYSCHKSLTTWFVQDPHNEEQVVATRTTSCVVFSCGRRNKQSLRVVVVAWRLCL